MKSRIAICVLVVGMVGCSSAVTTPITYEGKWERILTVMTEINAILDTVQDKESAEAAAPKLEKLVAEYNRLHKEIEGTNASSMEEMQRIQKEYMNPLMTEMGKFAGHSIRVQLNPNLSAAGEVVKEIEQKGK